MLTMGQVKIILYTWIINNIRSFKKLKLELVRTNKIKNSPIVIFLH